MRLGPQEIILIIVIIMAAAVLARIIRTGRSAASKNKESPSNLPARPYTEKRNRLRSLLRKTGIVFILIGIILSLISISILKWAFQNYLWAIIVIAIGFVVVFLSRKKG